MGFFSGTFSGLGSDITTGMDDDAINAAFNTLRYKKNRSTGKLVYNFSCPYDNVYVYTYKARAEYALFHRLKNAYALDMKRKSDAKLDAIRKKKAESLKNIFDSENKIKDKRGVEIKYMGKSAPEGLLMWIKNDTGEIETESYKTYWDHIRNENDEGTVVKAPGNPIFLDLTASVQLQSDNNVVLTKVQGRNGTRKEFISGGDNEFTISGKICSNYPDVYPTAEVSKILTLFKHQGVIQVYNLMFSQLNVTQIVIRNFHLSQTEGTKNEQPYSFTCVGIEPDEEIKVVRDTIQETNKKISSSEKKGWSKQLLDKIKNKGYDTLVGTIEECTNENI